MKGFNHRARARASAGFCGIGLEAVVQTPSFRVLLRSLLALSCFWLPALALGVAPVITGIAPTIGAAGTVVVITGSGFGGTPQQNTVEIGGLARVIEASSNQLTAIVPANPASGKVRVTVDGAWTQSADTFVVPPVVANLSPGRALPGTPVLIRGKNFSPSTSGNTVRFNGIPSAVTSASTIELRTTVPAGATSGVVEVFNGALTGTSAWPFEVLPTALSIDGFTPGTGPVGSTITLKGNYFGSTISANQVSLNGIPATITAASYTSLSVVVPNGATSGPLSLTVAGQTITTGNSFQVTETGTPLLAEGPTISVAMPAGQYVDLPFSAMAGENLGLGVTAVVQAPASSSKKPTISVLKPDNTVFKTLTCVSFCALDLSAMPVSGTYTVRVFANNPTSTLSAQVALTRAIETVLTSGQPVSLHMDRVGRISRVRFDGTAGESRALELVRSTDPLVRMSNRVEVRRADGSYLYSEGAAVYCASNCPGFYLLQNLPDTNTYTLIVQQSDAWSEDLQVKLIEPTPLEVDGPSIPAQANFSYQMGLFSFPALAGQRLDLGIIVPISANFLTNVFSGNWVRVSVFDPLGSRVSETPACESLTGQFNSWDYSEAGCAVAIKNVPSDGNYTVVIRDIHPSFATVEPTRFVATVSTPYVAATSVDGPEVSLNLNRPGQAGLVTFDGIVGQNLQFRGGADYNNAAYFPLTAYQPNAAVLLAFPPASTSGAVDLPTLPTTGTYTLEESAQGRKIFDRPLHIPVNISTLQNCGERAGAIATMTTFNSVVPAQVVLDSNFTVSASVTPSNGVCGNAVGTMKVTVQGVGNFCTYEVPSQSSCSLTATQAGVKTLSLQFIPADTTMFATSSVNASNAVTVVKKPVSVTIVSVSPEPMEAGQSLTTVVDVVPMPSATPAPTGLVYVNDSSGRSCSFNLPATSCSMIVTVAGIRSLTATYYGDSIYSSLASAAVQHTVRPQPPTITQFTPTSGLVGSNVTITGTNFLSPFGGTSVSFNGTVAAVSSATDTRLVAVVPNTATSGPIQVAVADRSVTTASNFTVTIPPPPTITSFTPASGLYGASVTINGANFIGNTSGNIVAFNGVQAAVTSATTTRIIAKVPNWSTTGRITVSVAGRTATSATNFTVTSPYPSPIVASFSPTSGVVGTPVTITGQGFTTASVAANGVAFNGRPAFVTQATATQLVALVPSGATTGPISVTVNGQTGTSAASFTVIPAGTEVAAVSIASVEAEPSIAGQSFTIHIAVTPESPTGPTPTGSVTVSDGVYGCLITLPATTCTAMQSEPGDSTLFAWYTGDETYASAFSPDFTHITNPANSTEICGFAPNTVPNDPPGFVPITQLSGAVYTAGQSRNIIGTGALSVTFDSPLDGASTPNGIIDVAGSFNGPVNTGITVNGLLAQTVNGRFLVPNVRLAPGTNSLEAVATTLPGLTATASISVTRSGSEPPVSFHAEQNIGMAPSLIPLDLDVGEALSGSNLQRIRIDTDGDGVFDYTYSTLQQWPPSFAYQKPGLFKALVEVTSSGGQVYTASQWLLIRSMAVERGALCDIYGYLKAKLMLADSVASSLAFAASVRPEYLNSFTQIGADLPSLAPELGTIVSGFAGPTYAELLVMRDNPDQTRNGFHVHMVQDADGVWRISGM